MGLGICLWQHYRLKSQLKPLLNSLPDTQGLLGSLPFASLVRREIAYLKKQLQQTGADLETWQRLVDLAPVGFLWVDADNQLLWCNRQARDLLKIDRWQSGEVRLLLELVRSYELDQIVQHTRESQKPQTREWQFYAASPTFAKPNSSISRNSLSPVNSLFIKASSYPLPEKQVGIFLENQQPLRELAQSRERAFSDLSHELRTPLTAISLVAETLIKRLQGRERGWAEQMLQETNRLQQLVQEWLDLSQFQESASRNCSHQTFELREAIIAAWQSLEPLAGEKGVALAYNSVASAFLIKGDRERLIQVFINLFDNSLQYSPLNSEIRVEVGQLSEMIRIDIIDSGSGFLETDLPHVFERFYRGDPSRTRGVFSKATVRSGSGLGLAITREIIEAHGGYINASNHSETGGAWLQLSLPTPDV